MILKDIKIVKQEVFKDFRGYTLLFFDVSVAANLFLTS